LAFHAQGSWYSDTVWITQQGAAVMAQVRFVGTYPDGKSASYLCHLSCTDAGGRLGSCVWTADFGSFFKEMKTHGGKSDL